MNIAINNDTVEDKFRQLILSMKLFFVDAMKTMSKKEQRAKKATMI